MQCFGELDCAKVDNTDNLYSKTDCVKTPEAFLDK